MLTTLHDDLQHCSLPCGFIRWFMAQMHAQLISATHGCIFLVLDTSENLQFIITNIMAHPYPHSLARHLIYQSMGR